MNFAKVIAHGSAGNGPSWFEARTKEGKTIEYGNTSDSKVEGFGSSTVYIWRINKISDNLGNTITYSYTEVNGESCISQIDYTTNPAAGLTNPYNSIKFEYIDRTDSETRYAGGSKIPMTKLLTWIKVETENSAKVRKYNFKYYLGTEFNKVYQNKSFLNEITEYGSNSTFMNSTVIGWGDDILIPVDNEGPANTIINNYYFGDFNGDGISDYVVTPKKTTYSGSDCISFSYNQEMILLGAGQKKDNLTGGYEIEIPRIFLKMLLMPKAEFSISIAAPACYPTPSFVY
jgi:hypothetical protein